MRKLSVLILLLFVFLCPLNVEAAPAGGIYYGTLFAPDVGIGVDVYTPSDIYSASCVQGIVDAPNSSVMVSLLPTLSRAIADHKHQGFESIKSLVPGEYIYIFRPECIDVYMVVLIDPFGSNTGSTILCSDGSSIYTGGINELSLYTCNSNWRSVTIVKTSYVGSFLYPEV